MVIRWILCLSMLSTGCQFFETGGLPRHGKPSATQSATGSDDEAAYASLRSSDLQAKQREAEMRNRAQLKQTQKAFAETIDRIGIIDHKIAELADSNQQLRQDLIQRAKADESNSDLVVLQESLESLQTHMVEMQQKLDGMDSRITASDQNSDASPQIDALCQQLDQALHRLVPDEATSIDNESTGLPAVQLRVERLLGHLERLSSEDETPENEVEPETPSETAAEQVDAKPLAN